MKLKHAIYLLALVFVTNACLKDGDEQGLLVTYTYYFYKTEITLTSNNEPLLIVRSDTNDIVQNKRIFEYSDSSVRMEQLNSNNYTQEVKVFELNEHGNVTTCFDTLFQQNGYILYESTYTYYDSASIPSSKKIEKETYEGGTITASSEYTILYNFIDEWELQEESVDNYFRSCSNLYYYNDSIPLKFDVLNPTSFLENLNVQFATEGVVFNYECSSFNPAKNAYYYQLNDAGYIGNLEVVSFPEYYYGQEEMKAIRIYIDYTYILAE